MDEVPLEKNEWMRELAQSILAEKANSSVLEAEATLEKLADVFFQNHSHTSPLATDPRGETVPETNFAIKSPNLEARYRTLVEQIPAVVFMIYLDGGIGEAYVSPQIESALGFSQAEWLEDPVRWYQRVHPEDKQRWSLEAAEMFLSGRPLRSAFRVIARDGHVVWFHCEAKMVRHENGRPWFIHGIGFDITELKLAEKALTERTCQLEGLCSATHRINAVLDVSTIMRTLVSAAMELTGAQAGTWGMVVQDKIVLSEYSEGEKRTPIDIRLAYSPDSSELAIGNKGPHISNSPETESGPFRTLCDTFSFYNAAYIPIVSRTGELFGCFGLHNKRDRKPFEQTDVMLIQALAMGAAVALENARILKEHTLAEESLRSLSTRLLNLQDDERRRIARELHDSTAQTLCGVMILLDILKSQIVKGDADAVRTLDEGRTLAEQASREIRDLSHLLHPPDLDQVGLNGAVQWYATRFAQRTGICIDVDMPTEFGRLSREVETSLFRVMQEGLANVHRHSGSPTAKIRITRSADKITLEIVDHGQGLPPDISKPLRGEAARFGIGINGMRERLRQLGGKLEIYSSNPGTTVMAMIPLANYQNPTALSDS